MLSRIMCTSGHSNILHHGISFIALKISAGESLDWFWRGWFLNHWKIDVAVKGVEYINNKSSEGSTITIANLEKLPMPVVVEIKEKSGKTGRVSLPVEVWQHGGTWQFNYQIFRRYTGNHN